MKSTNVWNSIKKYIVIIIIVLFTIVLLIYNFINNGKIASEGVYTIGKIIYKDFSARGTTYKYEFYVADKKYYGKTKAVGWRKNINDLIFLKVLPNNPNVGDIVDSVRVPSCLTLDSVPQQGWKELPLDKCK